MRMFEKIDSSFSIDILVAMFNDGQEFPQLPDRF